MAKTPTDKTFKGIFAEYPELFATDDYIWNKPLDKYTQKEINGFDAEVVDIAYNSGVAFLEQLGRTITNYFTRISVFIGYLLVLFAGLLRYVFGDGYLNIGYNFEMLAFIASLGYLVLMILLFRLMTSKVVAATHFPPKEFLAKDMMKHDSKLVKIYMCRTLQVSAEKNLSVVFEIVQTFKLYIKLFVYWTLIGIAGAVALSV